MSQRLETKNRGSFQVEKTWVVQGVGKIWKLSQGGYCKEGGIPIQRKADLTSVIPRGDEQKEAVEWFENRDKVAKVAPKKIVLNPDGSMNFDDGSPITGMSDLMNNLKPGPMLESALKMFVQNQMKEESKDAKANAPATSPKAPIMDAVDKLKAELESKNQAADAAEEEAEQEEP